MFEPQFWVHRCSVYTIAWLHINLGGAFRYIYIYLYTYIYIYNILWLLYIYYIFWLLYVYIYIYVIFTPSIEEDEPQFWWMNMFCNGVPSEKTQQQWSTTTRCMSGPGHGTKDGEAIMSCQAEVWVFFRKNGWKLVILTQLLGGFKFEAPGIPKKIH